MHNNAYFDINRRANATTNLFQYHHQYQISAVHIEGLLIRFRITRVFLCIFISSLLCHRVPWCAMNNNHGINNIAIRLYHSFYHLQVGRQVLGKVACASVLFGQESGWNWKWFSTNPYTNRIWRACAVSAPRFATPPINRLAYIHAAVRIV